MPSPKQLRGVAHDLAHHSQSSMSWLHPHLGEACRSAGVNTASLDLLETAPYPPGLLAREPLRLACASLQVWFLDLLARLGYEASAVRSVVLTFQFRSTDDYDVEVKTRIVTRAGKEYCACQPFPMLRG